MAFIQTSAALGRRGGRVLSADNRNAIQQPERHIVVELLRKAGPLLGLKPPVIATLDAMLSCLPPQRNHHTVFASNATLSFRRNGISDRTIRRHVTILLDAGLLRRDDSPNRKRFTRSNTAEGTALRFGFDLTPLFLRLETIAQLAAKAQEAAAQARYLRCKLRAAVAERLASQPDDPEAQSILKALRRKLSNDALSAMLEGFTNPSAEGDLSQEPGPTVQPQTRILSGSDGQNVRHHHKSRKDNIDITPETPDPCLVQEVVSACPEAAEFSLRTIATVRDVITHARTLAPMIGIDAATYERAHHRRDPLHVAVTVWLMMKFHSRIKNAGAYFRSVTSGTRAESFDPYALIRRANAFQTGAGLSSA